MEPGSHERSERGATALVQPLGHLAIHRRMILVRSVAAGLAGLVPVPILDDWAVSTIRRGALRRIADLRNVDLEEEAVRLLADGDEPAPSWRALLGASAVALLFRRGLRKAFPVVVAAGRADAIARTFAVLTLFDHYCARLHVGAGLGADDARALRQAMDHATGRGRRDFLVRSSRRALLRAGRAAVRAPFEIADALLSGAVRRRLARGEDAAAAEIMDEAVAKAADRPRSFLARAVRALDGELGRLGDAYVAPLVTAFEARAPRRRGGED